MQTERKKERKAESRKVFNSVRMREQNIGGNGSWQLLEETGFLPHLANYICIWLADGGYHAVKLNIGENMDVDIAWVINWSSVGIPAYDYSTFP